MKLLIKFTVLIITTTLLIISIKYISDQKQFQNNLNQVKELNIEKNMISLAETLGTSQDIQELIKTLESTKKIGIINHYSIKIKEDYYPEQCKQLITSSTNYYQNNMLSLDATCLMIFEYNQNENFKIQSSHYYLDTLTNNQSKQTNIDLHFEEIEVLIEYVPRFVETSSVHWDVTTYLVSTIAIVVITSILFYFIYVKRILRFNQRLERMLEDKTLKHIDYRERDELSDIERKINQVYYRIVDQKSVLEQERNLALKSEKTKDAFIKAASHELKTPLFVLSSMVEGMIAGVGPYQNHDLYLKKVNHEVMRMSRLVNEMVSAMSVDLNKNTQIVNVTPILEEVLLEYKLMFEENHLNVNKSDLPEIKYYAQPTLIKTVFQNILVNAIKYTKPYHSIYIDYNGEGLVIKNECEPLSQEEIEVLGQPFTKVKNGRISHGLGLYLVSSILRNFYIEYQFRGCVDGMEFVMFEKKRENKKD